MSNITVVTGNTKKAQEIGTIIGRPVDNVELDIAEIQSLDVEEVARDIVGPDLPNAHPDLRNVMQSLFDWCAGD